MSVGIQAAVINSAYVALTSAGGPESEIPAGTTTLYVIVTAEAGAAVIATLGSYTIRVLLQDIANFVKLANTAVTNSFGASPWTSITAGKDVTFAFPITLAPATTDSIYQVQAFLSVGAGYTEVSHVKSDLVIVS